MKETQELLQRLKNNNSKFNHFKYIPTESSFDKFHNSSEDLFRSSARVKKTRFLFSAKDIFNTYVYPTEMGSPIWKDFVAGNNARVISDALWSGDILVGKTVTSEFAVHDETCVLNPWNESRTVGTSSAGAPISILVDNLDYAMATQTAGSIGRPSSYTGVLAIKPTYGLIPRTGILKTCDPFDTVGFFAKDIAVMSEVLKTLCKSGPDYPFNKSLNLNNSDYSIPNKIACIEPTFLKVSDAALKKLHDLKKFFSSNNILFQETELPDFLSEIHKIHEGIYSYSLSYYFANELQDTMNVSDSFKETVEIGKQLNPSDFNNFLTSHSELKTTYKNWMEDSEIDFLITAATEDVAPLKHNDEPKDINLIYTFMGTPVIYLPIGFNNNSELPFGICISSYKHNEASLLKLAELILENFELNEGRNFYC